MHLSKIFRLTKYVPIIISYTLLCNINLSFAAKSPSNNKVIEETIIAEMHFNNHNFDEATKIYTTLAQQTQDVNLAKRSAEIAILSQDPTAIKMASNIWHKLDPNEAEPIFLNMVVNLKDQNIKAANNDLTEILQCPDKDSHELLISLFDEQIPRDLLEKLIPAITENAENLPENKKAAIILGIAAKRFPQLNEQAIQGIDKVLKTHPQWEYGIIVKAQLIESAASNPQSTQEALQYISSTVKKYPNLQELRRFYADVLLAMGKNKDAMQQYDQLLKNNNNNNELNPELVLKAAQAALNAKDYSSAEKYLIKMQSNPRFADFSNFYLANIAEAQKKYKEAQKLYSQVDGIFKMQARVQMAIMMAKNGEPQNAISELERLTQQYPAYKQLFSLTISQINTKGDKIQEK